MARLIPDWLLDTTDRVDESLWFLPVFLTLGSVAGSSVLLAIDTWFGATLDRRLPFLALGDAATAGDTLAVIGSSIISLTGVVFSITIVALTLASQQFGPRLLRTFLRDRSTQLVLGTFVATFLHTLIVRHALNWNLDTLPRLSIHGAVALAALDALLLVFFIHHVARSIQVGTVVRRVADEMQTRIEAHCPPADEPAGDPAEPAPSDDPLVITSARAGYVRVIEFEELVGICARREAWLEVLVTPGAFVLDRTPLARLHGDAADDAVHDRLRAGFAIGDRRTAVQDLAHSVDQLVELALRALSPGVNDPETAIACVHRLGQGLALLATRALPDGRHLDGSGVLRIAAPSLGFEELVARSFDRIARAGADHPEIRDAILATLRRAVEVTASPQRSRALADYEPPGDDRDQHR